jgi:hypothetical protein
MENIYCFKLPKIIVLAAIPIVQAKNEISGNGCNCQEIPLFICLGCIVCKVCGMCENKKKE